MDDDFDNSLADWHRAEAAAHDAEAAAIRLEPSMQDAEARSLRERASLLRQAADGLLAALLRMAGSRPAAGSKG